MSAAREILDNPPDVIAQIGLSEHLSPTRQNGLAALVSAIQAALSEIWRSVSHAGDGWQMMFAYYKAAQVQNLV